MANVEPDRTLLARAELCSRITRGTSFSPALPPFYSRQIRRTGDCVVAE
jgi:hypothetical protein